jgi:hypothetical protein
MPPSPASTFLEDAATKPGTQQSLSPPRLERWEGEGSGRKAMRTMGILSGSETRKTLILAE